MMNRYFVTAAFVLSAVLSVLNPAAGQEDYGPKYATMTDAELWAMVVKCEGKDEVVSLLDQIPLAVMAKHAKAAMEDPTNGPSFGNLITQVIWPELCAKDAPSRVLDNMLKTFTWTDSTGKYKVEAQIFDVRSENVVLRKADDSLVQVPIERLSRSAEFRLRKYSAARKQMSDRIPETKSQLVDLISKKMAEVLQRPSPAKLLRTFEVSGIAIQEKDEAKGVSPNMTLNYDATGTRLILTSDKKVKVFDVVSGKEVKILNGEFILLQNPWNRATHRGKLFAPRYLLGKDLSDGKAKVVDILKNETVFQIPQEVKFGAVSENSATAAWVTMSEEGTPGSVRILDIASKEVKELSDKGGPLWISEDGSRVLILSKLEDAWQLQLWDTKSAELIAPKIELPIELAEQFVSGTWQISRDCSLTIGPAGLINLMTEEHQKFDERALEAQHPKHHGGNLVFEFTPNSRKILFWGVVGEIHEWDVLQQKSTATWSREKMEVMRDGLAKFNPNGTKVAIRNIRLKSESGRDLGKIHEELEELGEEIQKEVNSGKLAEDEIEEDKRVQEMGQKLLKGLSFSPSLSYVETGQFIEVRGVETGKLVGEIEADKGEKIGSFAFSPTNRHLAVLTYATEPQLGGAPEIKCKIKIWRAPK